MESLIFRKNYLENDEYRKSFCNLAKETFKVNYDVWYKLGFWGRDSRYINYSFFNKENIVANISVNEFILMINGEVKKAVQIGTVMTVKEYRKKGLSRKLMDRIFEDYDGKCDFYYLFANETVTNFYPKFGFVRTPQKCCEIDAKDIKKKERRLEKLNTLNQEDFINDFIKTRVPISKSLSAVKDEWPLKTYCYRMFNNNLYYLGDEECIVVLDRDTEGICNIHDVLSKKEFNFDTILEKVVEDSDHKIKLGFIPNLQRYKFKIGEIDPAEDALFIKGIEKRDKYQWLFPITSQT